MPLSRLVFRRLLAGQPLSHRGCEHRHALALTLPLTLAPSLAPAAAALAPSLAVPHGRPPLLAPQRRSFLELFKPRRRLKSAELPAGLELMGELAYLQRDGLRLPPPKDVAKALSDLFAQRKPDLEDSHVNLALSAFYFLLDHPQPGGRPWFSAQQLGRMIETLLERRPQAGGQPHLAMGKLLDAQLRRILRVGGEQEGEGGEGGVGGEASPALGEYEQTELPRLVRLLTTFGESLKARDIMIKVYGPVKGSAGQPDHADAIRHGWVSVLRGFAREDDAKELAHSLDVMQQLSVPYTPNMQKAAVVYFAEKKLLQEAMKCFSRPLTGADDAESKEPLRDTLIVLLKACALGGEHAFGQQIVSSLLQVMPQKETWDAIFLWSAASGKGPDEIDRMMNVMVRRSTEEHQRKPATPLIQPDIKTINTLVEFAMSRQDSYSAERYIMLGEKRGIYPNEKTYTMQIRYRLSIHDIDGARTACYNIQGGRSGNEDSIAAVNLLIQAMCQSKPQHYDDIMTLVDDLHERKARLAPETIAALCVLHLRRGEAHDAIDLVQMHAHKFSPDQRVVIRKSLAAFIMDGQTSTADAWDTYQILRSCFPETPRSDRIPVMNEFFARKRSDMACHVFFHMRNTPHEDITATKEVYVAAFTGFARNADAESLELAHNQLKLDLNVELDTKVRNALMLAYAATGDNRRALELWAEIGASNEGPTYNSIAIAFRSCEGMPFGDQHAKSIWQRLKEMDIEIDKTIFTAYLGAISRNLLYDEAIALVESAEEEYGFTPDLYM